jgi:hypothetical protein
MKQAACLVYSLTLKMKACFSETSVDFQRTTWHCITGDRILHNHRYKNLKSYIWHTASLYNILCNDFKFYEIYRLMSESMYQFTTAIYNPSPKTRHNYKVNISFSLCQLIKHHIMETYFGAEVQLYVFNSALHRGERSASPHG